MDESTNSSDNATVCFDLEALEEIAMLCTETPTCALTTSNSDDDSDIEVIVGHNVSLSPSAECLLQSAMRWEGADVSNSALFLDAEEEFSGRCSNQSANDSLGRGESEGGVCAEEPTSESTDDYVVLDGYESDVDSELSGFDELQQSL